MDKWICGFVDKWIEAAETVKPVAASAVDGHTPPKRDVNERLRIDALGGNSDRAKVMIVPISKIQTRQDEDGIWIAKSNLLPGCHTHGRDRGEAILRFQEAAKAHLETLLETGRPIPPAFRDKFVLAA